MIQNTDVELDDWRVRLASRFGEWGLDNGATVSGDSGPLRARVNSDVGSDGDLMGDNLDGVATCWASDWADCRESARVNLGLGLDGIAAVHSTQTFESPNM